MKGNPNINVSPNRVSIILEYSCKYQIPEVEYAMVVNNATSKRHIEMKIMTFFLAEIFEILFWIANQSIKK